MWLLLLFVGFISLVAGICITLSVQWYIFRRYLQTLPYVGPPETTEADPFRLPQDLEELLKQDDTFKKENCAALNLLFQFLFKELRHTKEVQKWFLRKLSLEFEELLTRTTTGKLFDSITIRDIHLGTHFPEVKSILVKDVVLDEVNKHLDTLELCLDLEYSGGFQLSIDANMVLGKAAYVSVKVNRLIGQAQLQFTRLPYTHWSFSFYSEPLLELQVESQLQGRPLPHISSIIINQIRKAVRKKHTLPHYKIRHKPFFVKLVPEEDGGTPNVLPGKLRVTVQEITRLTQTPPCDSVYCSVAVDAFAWVEMVRTQNSHYVSLELNIEHRGTQPLGLIFRQEFVADRYQACIVVDTVTSMSPAAAADVKPGDVLVAIEGKKVTSLSQVARLLKAAGEKITLRVERRVWLQDQEQDTLKLPDQRKNSEGLRHRKLSEQSDSSVSNPASVPGSPAKTTDYSRQPSPVHGQKLLLDSIMDGGTSVDSLQIHKTRELPFSKVLAFSETVEFTITERHQYLNISVWGKGISQTALLGHVSVPLESVITASKQRHHSRMCALLPPDPHTAMSRSHKLSSHSGFEPCLCFGDILLSFKFTSGGEAPMSTTVKLQQSATRSLPAEEGHKQHDFVRTQFHRTTQCEFCGKKIWLKDAVQCRSCDMTCHKKCVVKCQVSTLCEGSQKTPTGNTSLQRSPSPTPRRASVLPEIITSVADGDNSEVSMTDSLSGLPQLLLDGGDEVSSTFSHLLQQPSHQDPMAVAKSTGKDLYSDLPIAERKEKINKLIGKLKAAIDAETQSRILLTKESNESKDPVSQARAEYLISKSDEKVQELAVLMLHCCAGLQHVQDQEDLASKSS
ncbi:PDZ domain-containing protein 8 isoform X1 [Schistocerca americana]|uniref:PDZ domain-containing protein 8 isoform X1 n=1 Tax=Schistocerca americana TaxID=7009 RepID=UPI001F4FD6EC|nr:PDZ domain-containing protein 8 isoform X1 [Schistocerca americana]